MSDITIRRELRPCFIENERGLFHGWFYEVKRVDPRWGDPIWEGRAGYVCGLVEFEDGTVRMIHPSDIRFADGKISEYCFKGDEFIDDGK